MSWMPKTPTFMCKSISYKMSDVLGVIKGVTVATFGEGVVVHLNSIRYTAVLTWLLWLATWS